MSTVSPRERTRLLEAMLEELVEKGYSEVEVTAAVRRAQLPAAAWSEHFPDKNACLTAAFDELTEQLRLAIVAGCLAGGDWPERVAGGLRALVDELAGRAAMAEALAGVFPSIGPEAMRRYQRFVESLGPMLVEGRAYSGIPHDLPVDVEMLAVGAVEALVFEQIQAGRTSRLAALMPELLFSILVPFLGPAAASEAMAAERARAQVGR